MHDKIRTYIQKNLGSGRIGNDSELVRTGVIDSMAVPQLVSYLQKTFAVRIPAQKLSPDRFRNVDAIVQLVKSAR